MFALRRLGTAVCVVSLGAPSFNLKQGLGKLVVDTSRQSDLYYLLGGDRRVHHYWCTVAHYHHQTRSCVVLQFFSKVGPSHGLVGLTEFEAAHAPLQESLALACKVCLLNELPLSRGGVCASASRYRCVCC